MIIERGIRESQALDVETLCILKSEKVWSINCDIHVLDDFGNVLDCANLAAVAALQHFRRPDISLIGNRVAIHSVEDRQPIPLSLHHTPICVTIGIFGGGKFRLVDPSMKEEL